MRNLLLLLRFDGSAFHGWQAQPNGITVQQRVQEAIARVTGGEAAVTGCSRTDAGVHARAFYCNFRTAHGIPAQKLPAALNYYLPEQIAVLDCREVPPRFHARYDCRSKTYIYRLHNARTRDPFLLRRALREPFPLDAARMHAQAQGFLGTRDFMAFCAAGSSVKSTVRTVLRAEVFRAGESEIRFLVEADGFLYHMVRIMTGTLLDIEKKRLPEGSVPDILASKDRGRAGVTAPAEGLYLWEAKYDDSALAI